MNVLMLVGRINNEGKENKVSCLNCQKIKMMSVGIRCELQKVARRGNACKHINNQSTSIESRRAAGKLASSASVIALVLVSALSNIKLSLAFCTHDTCLLVWL